MFKSRTRKNPPSLFGAVLFTLLGVIALIGLFWLHTQQQAFAEIATLTTGTVRELIPQTRKGSTTYAPVIEFMTANERVYQHTSKISSNPPAYTVGDRVEILYNPEDPEEVVIAKDNSIASNPMMIAVLVLSLVWTLIGIREIDLSIKRKKTQ
jgi:hypothetical protein